MDGWACLILQNVLQIGVVSLFTIMCFGVTQESFGVVRLVLGPHQGDFDIDKASVEAGLPRKARVF